MSAYAALKGSVSISSLFSNSDGEEDEVIRYQPNSSDEEEEEEGEEDLITSSGIPTPGIATPGISTPNTATAAKLANYIFDSNFVPNDDNLIISHDYIIVGLKVNEYIIVNGQCKLSIQRGAILLNNYHYLYAKQSNKYDIVSSTSQSLPIISSTQVIDRSNIEDTKTDENKHLFSNEYKSIIKLENLYTGLENIGLYSSPFKKFVHSNFRFDDDDMLNDNEKLFKTYSFEIVLHDEGVIGLNIDKLWLNDLNNLKKELYQDLTPKTIMIIGNKNSGKSTLSKTLLNTLVLDNQAPVSYLDLDPGQSEFSIPYCLSLTSNCKPIFGMNLPSSIASNDEDNLTHYYGFTTPQHQPNQYLLIIKSLFQHYSKFHKPKGNHLVINTPGWVKGYGKELLVELTSFINPNYLILLSSNPNNENLENLETLNNLTYDNLKIFQGFYQISKYSPSQLRTFNKLIYFHQINVLQFDFKNHLLDKSPLKLSYEILNKNQNDKNNANFAGINLVSILKYDVDLNFNIEDLALMIESSIMGIYLIENETYSSISNLIRSYKKFPNYLNPSHLNELLNYNNTSNVIFMGLCIIHSVNLNHNYFNIYFPRENQLNIKRLLLNGYKLLLVKGDGDLPSSEILMNEFVAKYENQLKTINRKKRKGELTDDDQLIKLPYISFENKNKIGGVWKVRRNVMRRSHQR